MKRRFSTSRICPYDPSLRRLETGDYDYYAEDDNEIDARCQPTLALEPGEAVQNIQFKSKAMRLTFVYYICNITGRWLTTVQLPTCCPLWQTWCA